MRCLAVLCASVATLVTPAKAQVSDAVRTEIVEAEELWRQARINGDVAFLEHFYGKEARIQGMDGKALTREADIAMFKTGQIKPKFITHGPLEIRTYGDIAIVTGVDHLGGTAFGRYGEMFLRFTDVLVKRDGRWQLIVQQATSTTGF
ncbi:nuclear transport factor 2 family protein [Novosphingobium kaempferiae]|uniref:nuclear transport factor 2 family protein n=1 Tax=Novosphingobium kaempferiae TaxID=2896849 RepID=UPI001E388104|nr:nuclear transport factor 2 family protein [Novosphingobium kaempferiae]